MGTCYSKKDAKQIQWIKAAVVKVENKKIRLTRRLIEDKLIELKLGVKL